MIFLPNAFSGSGVLQNTRKGTSLSRITGGQGPIPLPMATRTMFRNSGAMRNTPEAGTPPVQILVGGFSIGLPFQSPAWDTMVLKPALPSSVMVAKACHSHSGLSKMWIARPGGGVQKSQFDADCQVGHAQDSEKQD